MTTFYLGKTAISFLNHQFDHFSFMDEKFLIPIMQTSVEFSVEIIETGKLPIPNDTFQKVGNLNVWKKGTTEIRLYNLNHQSPYMLSLFHKNKIIIYVLKNEWAYKKRDFRPWFHIHLEWLLLKNNSIVLHSASIIVNEEAILFTAPSGTGKTTQTDLWHKHRKNVQDLNGDRTLLQMSEDGWFACGFPMYGALNRCEQRSVPIKGIVIIRQHKTNSITELSTVQKISLLFSETTVFGSESYAINKTLDCLEDLISKTTIVQLNCNMEESAVSVLEQRLNNEVTIDGNISCK